MTTPMMAHALPPSRRLHRLLWTAQWLLAVSFCWGATMKLTQPIAQLAATWPWTGDLPAPLVRLLGLIDLAGGLGLVLPALARIAPGLTVLAARGCVLLQLSAMVFHGVRGEWSVLPVNIIFLCTAAFIAWGRARNAP